MSFVNRVPGIRCDTETGRAALEEMVRYCEAHSDGPAALRKPQLYMRGTNFVVLLGPNIAEGIAGFGRTVSAALRAFEVQYLRSVRAPDSELASEPQTYER